MEKEKKIKLNERVEVVGTGKVPSFPKGKKFNVHPELAKKLIASGKAAESGKTAKK
jgi:hypothetical protein